MGLMTWPGGRPLHLGQYSHISNRNPKPAVRTNQALKGVRVREEEVVKAHAAMSSQHRSEFLDIIFSTRCRLLSIILVLQAPYPLAN